MKIAIYAISKNEGKLIERMLKSCKDADNIFICDTGSNDQTVKIAQDYGAKIHNIVISPWRFDDARNASLALIDNNIDICVSIDCDEYLTDGWRDKLENAWKNGTNRIRYKYQWDPDTNFILDKIHARKGFRWKYPCHEALYADKRIQESVSYIDSTLVIHEPDHNKNRSEYLQLLKIGIEEEPFDTRASFYYGRELFFNAKFSEAVNEFQRYIDLPGDKVPAENSYVARLIAKCLMNEDKNMEALTWCEKAIKICPDRRESWVYLAQAYYNLDLWMECYSSALKAISIENHRHEYPIETHAWGYLPFDLAAVSAFKLGRMDEAVKYGEIALQFNPNDTRLKINMLWYLSEQQQTDTNEQISYEGEF